MRRFLIVANFIAVLVVASFAKSQLKYLYHRDIIPFALIFGSAFVLCCLNLAYVYSTDAPTKGRFSRFVKSIPRAWKESA